MSPRCPAQARAALGMAAREDLGSLGMAAPNLGPGVRSPYRSV